jgi:hypothetical protein
MGNRGYGAMDWGLKAQVIQHKSRRKSGGSTFRCFLEFGYHIRAERDDTGKRDIDIIMA